MDFSIKNIQLECRALLGSVYPIREIDSILFLVFEKVGNLSRLQIISNSDTKISISVYNQIMGIVERLLNYEPIQYILEETEFYGLLFKVNQSVLIPRPETEELVHWIVEDGKNKPVKAIDFGTGSGCIAISLAKLIPDSKVHAVDISEQALLVASENALRNGTVLTFHQADILTDAFGFLAADFDLVVSNPPYIREKEKVLMQRNVLDYEPVTALFVSDADPLIFYRRIAQLSKKLLKKGGALYFEINEGLGNEMIQLLEELNYLEIELRCDLHGKRRMMKATQS
ncbi:MAG TPA: peptide chain release factor N(5)-glutamine methyltransferase [Marinilabiliales bacterium]|nr:MAG: protein-(glutamine-N5) methyltransferase, release factor-specific [Bacteroidetes bacterium GWC2_40_13]OFX72523.1 MAG: protein-(glutamine-N5) methyltransferase, release factor-specific [Bacteroidetes bacterium GWD2_40_43]OFX90839.1 MAG: protein-(glutamine-N5) methyltransferase, release factor-specific [Bacteroidetes bacterium GWE2_40_63]OFY17365.1 MAG: protein-(glutamine-N5) methyltransferase, release factor-specific [Bacteroidetes bacterium GWF2_40_13]OFZ26487.1 MAG: protein-(glutamine-